MNLGLFQLENLVLTRTRFTFLDVSQAPRSEDWPASVRNLINQAVVVASEQVENHLREQKVDRATPIVLLCENGQTSSTVASRLERSGYENVYTIARGIEGLLSEL